MLESLAIQVRYLDKRVEIHLLGNHLLSNAKALLFAGLVFRSKEAYLWFRKGFKLFDHELSEQVLADGGHFELSPMYHSIILEDLLDIINLFKAYRQIVPRKWLKTIEKMYFWLQNMCHFDEEIAFFNDAALGVAPTLHDLKEYQQRLNLLSSDHTIYKNKVDQKTLFLYLQNSGYCRLQNNNMLLLADVANIGPSYQPGHAHADTLSFELSIGKQRLIVNSGTSCYSNKKERLRQRGSKAHNTLVIDGLDSSEVWKSFRVAHRAKIKSIKKSQSHDEIFLSAIHDGYARLNNLLHSRTWRMRDHLLVIEDEVLGSGLHKIDLIFHIHPDIQINQKNDRCMIFCNQFNQAIASLEVNAILRVLDSSYHPMFNTSIPNKKIMVELKQQLPLCLNTSIKTII